FFSFFVFCVVYVFFYCFFLLWSSSSSSLFPYTTLFRSFFWHLAFLVFRPNGFRMDFWFGMSFFWLIQRSLRNRLNCFCHFLSVYLYAFQKGPYLLSSSTSPL